eukprot:jgi/Tetstr1/447610/TSEL_034971.t1
MAEASSDSDDLWGYGGGKSEEEDAGAEVAGEGGAVAGDDDDDDDYAYMTHEKRLQLARERNAQSTRRPDDDDVIFISDDEDAARKNARSAAAATNKRKAAALEEEEDDDWALTPPQSQAQPLQIEPTGGGVDHELAEMLRENSEAMRALEDATKEAVVTEGDLGHGGGGGDNDSDGEIVIDSDGESDGDKGNGPSEAPATEAAVDKVLLTMRCDQHREYKVKIAKSAPFQKCIDAFRAHAEGEGWIAAGASFKLVFDGERVQPDQTPEGLDCDDGDVIDVHC